MKAKLILLSFVVFFTGCLSNQESKPNSPSVEILCERKPTVYVVGSDFSSKSDECTGEVKIQGIAYQCGDIDDVEENTRSFYKGIVEKSQDKCEEYCRKKGGSDCIGTFSAPSECGFSVPRSRAKDVGENLIPCPNHCKGRSFSYCSTYHASYLRTDESLFTDKPANCSCRRNK